MNNTPARIDLGQMVIVAFMVSGAVTSIKGHLGRSFYVNVHTDPDRGLLISQNAQREAETIRRQMTKTELIALRDLLVAQKKKNNPVERLLDAIAQALGAGSKTADRIASVGFESRPR